MACSETPAKLTLTQINDRLESVGNPLLLVEERGLLAFVYANEERGVNETFVLQAEGPINLDMLTLDEWVDDAECLYYRLVEELNHVPDLD